MSYATFPCDGTPAAGGRAQQAVRAISFFVRVVCARAGQAAVGPITETWVAALAGCVRRGAVASTLSGSRPSLVVNPVIVNSTA
jgi:hypothetical protein